MCFRLILTDENVVECCSIETCVELPPCDCLQIRAESIDDPVCSPDGLTVDFDYSFTIENLFGQVLEHAFLLSLTPGVTFDPDYFDLPSVPPNGQVNLSTTVLGASPGQEVCFLVTVHNANLEECCSIQHCITAPDCPGTGACCYTFGGLQICNEVTEPECSQLGGTFLPDTPCDPDPCALTGACCILDPGGFVFCIVVPESECSGFAFFPGADCDPEPCTVTGGVLPARGRLRRDHERPVRGARGRLHDRAV